MTVRYVRRACACHLSVSVSRVLCDWIAGALGQWALSSTHKMSHYTDGSGLGHERGPSSALVADLPKDFDLEHDILVPGKATNYQRSLFSSLSIPIFSSVLLRFHFSHITDHAQ